MKLSKYSLVFLSVIGGILSGVAWTGWCTGLVLLVSLVPFFVIENHLYENRKRYTPNAYFLLILPGLLIFSIIVMGWMRVASIAGAVMVITGLTFLMAISLWLAFTIRIRAGNMAGITAIFVLWLTYEFASLNISIISPWMNLGNGLAKDIAFIQWYEYTGTGGGSLWILLSNYLMAHIIIRYSSGKETTPLTIALIVLIMVPSLFSLCKYNTIKECSAIPEEVVIVQPNTDPYSEKFVIPFKFQLQKVIRLASDSTSQNTSWIITPETTVDDPVNLDDLQNNQYIKMIQDMVRKYPNSSVVAGLVTFRQYNSKVKPPTRSAVKRDVSGYYSDHYNSAVKIDTGKNFAVYHKSKLVPGIEMQFFNGPGRLLKRLLPYLGGTRWGYGSQDDRGILEHTLTGTKIAPIICYESVFGSYMTEYIREGASAIFIITNDGWWKNTGGYRQHLSYASLRAIETRRPVARCGNTGISCFIDINGNIREETGWYREAVIKGFIIPEEKITFYVKHGDYIMHISLLISILIILYAFIVIPLSKKQKNFNAGMQPSD
ncbi:MAG TPA: apolipoprotein N-acyltransferase [Bacteroidales bacterium]|nr:apolipoprotein N-acyltransferase [Bacteroidales bacterium]